MKHNFIILLSMLFLGCKSYNSAVLFDTDLNMPKRVVNHPYNFSFNIFLDAYSFLRPSKPRVVNFELPKKYLGRRDLLYLIKNDVNVVVIIDVIRTDKILNRANLQLYVDDSSSIEVLRVKEKGKTYDIIEAYKSIGNDKLLRIGFVSGEDSLMTKIYPYIIDYARNFMNSIKYPLFEIESKQIKQSIFNFMYDKYEKQGNYLQGLYILNALSDSIKFNNIEGINLYKSFVGDYGHLKKERKIQKKKNSHISYLSAKETLLRIAPKYNFLLFNEDHQDPYSRYFLKTLLKDFANKGFKNLGVETLANINHDINRSGFPIHGSGFYSDEPNMANLIREATSLGYNVFAFDENSTNCDTCSSRISKRNYRELKQALNIIENTNQTNNKTIILSGHGHVYKKSSTDDFRYMAEHLKMLTNQEILSINQTFQEHYPRPSILLDVIPINIDGNFYLTDNLKGFVDLQIIHNSKNHYLNDNNFNLNIGSDCTYKFKLIGKDEGYFAIYIYKEDELFPSKRVPVIMQPYKNIRNVEVKLNSGKYLFKEYDNMGFPLYYTIINCN